MKLLRHPPLAFWTFACVVLIGALATFAIVGTNAPQVPLAGADPASADGAEVVHQIRNRMISLPALTSAGGDALRTWSIDTATIAADAAESRYDSHGPTDALAARLDMVATAAADLAEADGTVAVRAAAGRLYTIVDSLVAVIGGVDPGPPAPPAEIEPAPIAEAPDTVDPDLVEPTLDTPSPAAPNPTDPTPGA